MNLSQKIDDRICTYEKIATLFRAGSRADIQILLARMTLFGAADAVLGAHAWLVHNYSSDIDPEGRSQAFADWVHSLAMKKVGEK